MKAPRSLAAIVAAIAVVFCTCQKSISDPVTTGGGGNNPPKDTVAAAPKDTILKVAYVEVNSNNFNNAGCYVYDTTHQFFNVACIFAANINLGTNGKPVLYYNTQVSALLSTTSYIRNLQADGIKVLLTVLGNHQNAGWSCFTDTATANDFAAQLSAAVTQYGFDGIDIDDEYSACTGNDSSLIIAANAIRQKMPGKILSKALYNDLSRFTASWHGLKLGNLLDYGWEMSYGGNPAARIAPYLSAGIPAAKLGLGASNGDADGTSIATYVKSNGLKAMMVYNVNNSAQSWLSGVSQVLLGVPATAKPGCLQ